MSQTIEQDMMVNAIDVAMHAVQAELETPKSQTTKSTKATKPTKARKRQLFNADHGKGGKRARTVSNKAKAAAKRREEEAKQAKKAFVPLPLGDLPDELKSDDGQIDPEHAEGGEDTPIDLSGDDENENEMKKKDDSSSSSSSEADNNDDDVSSGSDDNDEDDAANIVGSGVESGAENAAEDDFDQCEPTQHVQSDEEQEDEDDAKDADVIANYTNTFAVDAEELYEWAQQYFPNKDINALMKHECDHGAMIPMENKCYKFIAAMVTNYDESGRDSVVCDGLMMIFIAELLKNVDSQWTGIQKAYEQVTSDPYEPYVTEFIRDNGEDKDLKTKALSRVLQNFYKTIDEHGKLPEFKQIYDQVWGKDTEEESDAKIKTILQNTIASDEAFGYLKESLENFCNDCEGNVLLFWPLDKLYAIVDEKNIRARYEAAHPEPVLNYSPTMETDELLNAHKIHKEELDKHKKKISEMILQEKKKARSQCFLRKLVEATITILDCCEEKGDDSWETIQKTIQGLAEEFDDRVSNATEDIQKQCKLGWYKLAMYQNMYARKKMKLHVEEVGNYKCDFGAALTFTKKKPLFYHPHRQRKKGDFYTLKNQRQWVTKIKKMQLPDTTLTKEQKAKKNLYLPRPLLEDGRTACEKVSLEKRIDYLFSILHFASLSHCLMDRTAFYNSRYYNVNPTAAYPTNRMNAAFQALSKVYVSVADLKK